MARPQLPPEQRKNVKIEVYVTPPWFESVTASAKAAGTDVSNYIRNCVERIQAKEVKKAPPAKKAAAGKPPTRTRKPAGSGFGNVHNQRRKAAA